MAIVKPFQGVVYNRAKAGHVKDVLAPPYDVISPGQQNELYSRSPYNVVRLILGKVSPRDTARNNRYTRARQYLARWLGDSVLATDRDGAIYVYSQDYREDAKAKRRTGFIALMKLETSAGKKVLPHERTFAAPKEDRLKLIEATGCNLSPIFTLYKDEGGRVGQVLRSHCRKEIPFIDVSLEGVRHRFWRLTDKTSIAGIARAMRGRSIFIADGHHRYEVALKFRERMRAASRGKPGAYDYVMMYCTDMAPRGMTILAAHRMIRDIGAREGSDVIDALRRCFRVKEMRGASELVGWLKRSKDTSGRFGLFMRSGAYVVSLKGDQYLREMDVPGRSKEWKRLDVSILHHLILKKLLAVSDEEGNVAYTRDPKEAVEEVRRGNFALTFLMNPTKISQVEAIARHEELMPHKATYFYPKLLSGLVINRVCDRGVHARP